MASVSITTPAAAALEPKRTSTSFLRRCWYVAGLASELADGALVGRTILDEPVLLYRDSEGDVAAIGNRCPHRFAPLSKGRLEGDKVVCGYHGLGFDRNGRCVHNPHGGATSVRALTVPSYVLRERGNLLWIWMGEAKLADEALIPEYESLDPASYFIGEGYLFGNANYELMSDNILDLSHIEYLHPGLGSEAVSRAKVEVKQDGDTLITTRRMVDEMLPLGLARVYQAAGQRVNRTMEVTWQAPANMVLTVTIKPAADAETWVRGSKTLHLFTPESADKTHYFYIGAMRREASTQELAEMFFAALGRAFLTEDKPMIDAQQAMIGGAEMMDLKPALLPIDKAAILARRTLSQKIAGEA